MTKGTLQARFIQICLQRFSEICVKKEQLKTVRSDKSEYQTKYLE